MKISVVIPAYNEEKYLPACLGAFLKQETPPDEIIVVDNNSTDATALIAKQYGAKVVKERRQGMIYSRNKGFNTAKYNIIARCDADSIVSSNWIKQIKKSFTPENIIAITGPCYYYDLQYLCKYESMHKLFINTLYFKPSKIILGHEVLFGSNMALSRQAWMKIKNEVCTNDKAVHEDMDLTIHLRQYGNIKFERNLIASISARRLRSAKTLIDYPSRWIKSLSHSRKIARLNPAFTN